MDIDGNLKKAKEVRGYEMEEQDDEDN